MKKEVKKFDLVKISGAMVLLTVLLTWIIPQGTFSGTEMQIGEITRIGIFDFFTYGLLGMYYFTVLVTFIFVLGGFYQVLSRIGGYQALITKLAKIFKKKEILFTLLVSFIFTAISAVTNEYILLLAVVPFIMSIMKEMKFTEIQTPIITASSPEGARDFIVPSRKYKGKFYALPQAPQIYKQLLMVSGFNKYFQIAPCFRDEDCRADRTLEFYQLDLEMSFATEEDVYAVGEKVFYNVFKTFGNKEVSPYPFRRIAYKDAMLNYGSDKPDLRNPLIIKDATNILSKMDFAPFNGKMIRVIKTENMDKSNSWYKQVEEFIKGKGASGLATIKITEDGTFKSSLDKFMTDEIRTELKNEYELKEGDALFILADEPKKCPKLAGALRTYLGEELNLINKDKFEFCIINDFPMYEENEETGAIDFGHNPFSMPKGGLEALNNEDPLNITAIQYDFVCNGYEMSSGAVRNHDIEIMKKAFDIVGYDEEVIKNKFRSLYTAFQFGAPPHAGMAPGIDRIIMLLTGEENLREVQIFPPNVSGVDLLMGGPIELEEKQLRELHIKVRD